MPTFIVTHGSVVLEGLEPIRAGKVFDADPSHVAHLANVLPFVEGEQSLEDFVSEGGTPSAWHGVLLKRRAKKAKGETESAPVDPKDAEIARLKAELEKLTAPPAAPVEPTKAPESKPVAPAPVEPTKASKGKG